MSLRIHAFSFRLSTFGFFTLSRSFFFKFLHSFLLSVKKALMPPDAYDQQLMHLEVDTRGLREAMAQGFAFGKRRPRRSCSRTL
jgi:hypothetical protein